MLKSCKLWVGMGVGFDISAMSTYAPICQNRIEICHHMNTRYPNDKGGKELRGNEGDIGSQQAQLVQLDPSLQED